jgi:hypothetical protein
VGEQKSIALLALYLKSIGLPAVSLTASQIPVLTDNLHGKLNDGLDEARAWAGSLIKARQRDLDGMITAETVVESVQWWGADEADLTPVKWWGDSTIYLDLLSGQSVEQVCRDARSEHFIGIYALIYFSEAWQAEHGAIQNSNFTNGMLAGKYDKVFEKSVKGENLSRGEKVDAYLDAKAPWVPGFIRPLIEVLAGKRLDDDEPEPEAGPDDQP